MEGLVREEEAGNQWERQAVEGWMAIQVRRLEEEPGWEAECKEGV